MSAAIDIGLWSLFCAGNDYDPKRGLGSPWNQGGWTYATDGRVILRFPTSEMDSPENEHRPNVGKLFDEHWGAGDMRQWPYPPIVDLCMNCGGTDEITKTLPCKRCRGSKRMDCHCCGQETDCDECDDGTRQSTDKCPCTGDAYVQLPIDAGHAIARKYVRRISRLSGVEYRDGRLGDRILFTFGDGGQGMCMSLDKTAPGYDESK